MSVVRMSAARKEQLRALDRQHEDARRLVRDFTPRGHSHACIYAVVLRDHPEVTKVGRTAKWRNRRKAYADWNLSNGDGILAERTFIITEEFVDLALVEEAILDELPFSRHYKREWYKADIEEVERAIDRILCGMGLSYVSHG